jgi:hypothetical protein
MCFTLGHAFVQFILDHPYSLLIVIVPTFFLPLFSHLTESGFLIRSSIIFFFLAFSLFPSHESRIPIDRGGSRKKVGAGESLYSKEGRDYQDRHRREQMDSAQRGVGNTYTDHTHTGAHALNHSHAHAHAHATGTKKRL